MPKSLEYVDKNSMLEYILMFFVLCISGNPLFIYTESKFLYVASAIIMFILCLMKGKKRLTSKLIYWVVCSCILFIFQNSILELTSLNANINFIARLYIAFMTASFFGYRFRNVYFKVMVVVCAISILFFILQIFGVSFGYEFDRYKSILFYCFTRSERNSGMFWEPGAFQGFIMLVPLLYSDNLIQLWKSHKKECIILILALLTTKSTTGYITFAAFLFLTMFLNKKISLVLKTVLIALAVPIFVYAWSQDFMGEKLVKEYEEATMLRRGEVSWNRMGVMVIDYENIVRHPIIGNGFMDESRYGILGEYMRGAGNGFTGAINMFGIPFILLYFIGIFKNLVHLSKANRFVFIFVVILLLNGEYFLNYPLFWSFLFIKFPKYENNCSSFNRTQ